MRWPRWLWMRALGLLYLSAFVSLVPQIRGLIGPRGVLPAGEYLEAVREQLGLVQRVWYAPTLFWLGHSDAALLGVTLLGLAASVLLVVNVMPRVAAAVAWLCFLSFVAAGQAFASYQSDGMLLEAGFISLFLAPAGLRPGLDGPVPRWPALLLVWEWFRIYFESGVVKLLSGDAQWRALTAMDHYYENGPLPSWIGWTVQERLPHAFHAGTVILTFVLELGVVWLAFLPRRFRVACFFVVTPFQAAIILTANYAFLNYLVLFLGVWLLDDAFFRRAQPGVEPWAPTPRWQRFVFAALIAVTVIDAPGVSRALPIAVRKAAALLGPFRIANRYGLFAVMTTDRYEIEFQGSRDGTTWTPYPFRFKPQDVREAPGLYAPYQPRFEWNLWFASLSDWETDRWVVFAEVRLLEGAPQVLRLFRSDPFQGAPPRFVRAVRYQYWFATPEERAQGLWWTRRELGLYAPVVTLRNGEPEIVE